MNKTKKQKQPIGLVDQIFLLLGLVPSTTTRKRITSRRGDCPRCNDNVANLRAHLRWCLE